jgi:hypothetical protein
VLGIHCGHLLWREPEAGRIKLIDMPQKAAMPAMHFSRSSRLGVIERLQRPSAGRHLSHGIHTPDQQIPKGIGITGIRLTLAPRETTAHSHHGNGFGLQQLTLICSPMGQQGQLQRRQRAGHGHQT